MATSTGRGDWPLVSAWTFWPWNQQFAAANGPNKAIWSDWVFNATAGGAFTLVAESGSFTLAGTAATLKVGRRLIAVGETYVLTGTTAILKVGRVLSAAAGTYSVTGTAATLRVGRTLSATAGAFSVTGTAATLKTGRRLSATNGVYTVLGTDATLTYTPVGGSTPIFRMLMGIG